ncbi:MAG: succinic semialdehyde dehydrogenase [bacterium]|nr:succinic semialdehyde dehydrogenase [bacterium]
MTVLEPPSVQTIPPSAAAFRVTNPVTGALIGELPVHNSEAVAQAVRRARDAQPAWEALGVKGRMRCIDAFNRLLWARRDRIIEIIRRETGKTEGGAFTEVLVMDLETLYYKRHAARLLRRQWRTPAYPMANNAQVAYRPYGVVGLITPWNYPLLLGLCDAVQALIAGNAVVIKPSEVTPYTSLQVIEWMREAGLPDDVAQVVTGLGATGAALIDHVDYVSFTGSTATGRKVAVRCAERLIPCSLELGGKDPAIVTADADMDDAARCVLTGALENAGQACVSTERVYVEAAVYEPFMRALTDHAQRVVMSSGGGLGVHVGSMTNERELIRVEEQIAEAVAMGAKVIVGGKRRPDIGPLFFEPTILTDVTHDMRLMRDETFGPLIPVMRVESLDEAVKLANDSEYGLSAAIYSKNIREARRLARRIVAGDVTINHPMLTFATPGAPMGGAPGRQSGIGRRNGAEGLLRFVSPQTVTVDTGLVFAPHLSHTPPRVIAVARLMHHLRRWLPL